MQRSAYVDRVINLMDPEGNTLLNMSRAVAEAAVASGDPAEVRKIRGQFAILQKDGNLVRMARSLGRPMRYFLAKQTAGPCLIVAERIDQLHEWLKQEGLDDQFHPSYSRMVPAHYVVELALIGCPDPAPKYRRYFTPTRNALPADPDVIGRTYIEALAGVCSDWLDRIGTEEPIGVMFSGGIDSGSVLLILYHLLLARGQSPARLKAFTLSVDDGGADYRQAAEFLASLKLSMLLEVIDVSKSAIRYQDAIRVVEDYKPLDIQAAAMGLALCRGIRARYPDWRYLVDGDGGDENLKDYPIEENSELTINSVLNNSMLYQEGWGVEALKHSLVYSGGQSRGHVRTYAPARACQFVGFSPYALPDVIAVSEAILFIQLTEWDHRRLYAMKGDIVRRGVKAVTGIDMPVFEKCRFQNGVVSRDTFAELFPPHEAVYRREFSRLYA